MPSKSQSQEASQEGSATVVASAEDTEYAFDNSFTPALVGLLQNNPNLSLDEVLGNISSGALLAMSTSAVTNSDGLHHPTIVQYGQTQENSNECRDSQKIAVLVANQNYTHLTNLSTPIAEAGALAGELSGRGYDANVHTDQGAGDMSSLYSAALATAQEGDDIVAYYGGHGSPSGLCGRDEDVVDMGGGVYEPANVDTFSNGQVAGVVSDATSKGAHIRFVMDSCHSGEAAQAVRDERIGKLAEGADSLGDEMRVIAMQGISIAKESLITHCRDRERVLTQLHHALDEHITNHTPPAGAPAAQVAGFMAIKTGLEHQLMTVGQAYNDKADAIWATMQPMLATIALLASTKDNPLVVPPVAITDYRTLGAQINSMDDIMNACGRPMEQERAEG
jgi:hypothetical protein